MNMQGVSRLVSDLPEIYQAIYGHPELSERVSRPCQDRLEKIIQVYDALKKLLGRPLRVLDLGCAQGFFCFSLSERGATVHGVDFLDKNIAVCNALARENKRLKVRFETGLVEEVIAGLEFDQYDLVLGLSVFHHIVHEKGADEVKGLLERATSLSGALIVELALHDEPLYWGPAQPQDPRKLLEAIAFVHEIARHGTHLSSIPRPLYFASTQYWVLGDNAGRFETWSKDPHTLAHDTHEGSRRYFFDTDVVVKHYLFDHRRGEHNRSEFVKEKQFLTNTPPGFSVPTCILTGENYAEGWIVIERWPGRLLLTLLRDGVSIDHREVLLAVLDQLAILEAAGLYHDDVRTWNVLVTDGCTVHLIDYGSISSKKQDCVWPENLFLSFFIFVREVVTGVVDDPNPLRSIAISPYGLPQPYRAWAEDLWKRPFGEWTFKLMHEILVKMTNSVTEISRYQPIEAWMKAIEEAIQLQKYYINNCYNQVDIKYQQAEVRAQQAELRAQQAEIRAQRAEAKVQQAEKQVQQAEAKVQQAEIKTCAKVAKVQWLENEWNAARVKIDELEHSSQNWWSVADQLNKQLQAVYASWSWRITWPLRKIAAFIYRFFSLPIRFVSWAFHLLKRSVRWVVIKAMSFVLKRDRLSSKMLTIIGRYPTVKAHLLALAQSSGLIATDSSQPSIQEQKKPAAAIENALLSGQESKGAKPDLSPRAARIYADLQKALQMRKL